LAQNSKRVLSHSKGLPGQSTSQNSLHLFETAMCDTLTSEKGGETVFGTMS